MICLKLHLKAKNTFGGSPEPPEVSGGSPCQTNIDCIERVKDMRQKMDVYNGNVKLHLSNANIAAYLYLF